MKVFAGSDHAGLPLKKKLVELLTAWGHQVEDLGTHTEASCDYPDFAHAVARRVVAEPGTIGLLTCGSGIGMSIAANRHPGIRAALCHDPLEARLCREHNDANVLVMGGRLLGEEMAAEILRVFLATSFSGGRHAPRIRKIEERG
ncbi:MAG: Ribose 5-phosphate isomerase B [Candidatus Ozemobacter sibiricus]|jgi:ribose 5-phosphate isomerase B|uniref:Ribose 5-phosphate isomerase B n=1 Tax=Candidatus Ozemobacter sibiricus TaxID=2268124 RepID=A0A367ZKS6_9BACT|nr:MAG: Ribose 5-phosphate isomerase B [Candidatus Ozemobacter sibiricus]